jgi:micrococcal nuclease
MQRIVASFFLLTSLLMAFPAPAQEDQQEQPQPELHMLHSATVQPQKTGSSADQNSQTIMKQDFIVQPPALEQPTIPMVHMGQHMIDAPNIQMPKMPPFIQPGGTISMTPYTIPPQAPAVAPVAAPVVKAVAPPAENTDFSELHQGDTAIGQQVIDPLRILMKDGRIIQLAGIDIPDFDPYDPGPVSLAARNLLKEMVEGQQVRLFVTKNISSGRMSRLGDMLAHLELPKEAVWVQGALLAAGLARVRPSQRNPEMAVQMMKLENKARLAKKGLWADPRYAVLTPDNAANGENGWGIVEGTVISASSNHNIVDLEFGPDARTDFTLALNSDIRREMEKRSIDPLALAGKHLRVRGWLRDYNGPYMELDNLVWLEIIPQSGAAAASPAFTEVNPSAGREN